MQHRHPLQRAALAFAVAIAAGTVGAAPAGDALHEETRIDVRTQGGPIETVIVNALQPGESRSLTTAAGHPALITRTPTGLRLDVAGESFDIAIPEPGAGQDEFAALGPDAKIVRIEKHGAGGAAKDGARRIIVKHHGEDAGAEVDEAVAHAHAGMVATSGPLEDGQRVRVVRQFHHEAHRDDATN